MLAPRPSRTMTRIAVIAAVGIGVALGSTSITSAAWADAQPDDAVQNAPANDESPDTWEWD